MKLNKKATGFIINLKEDKEIAMAWNGKDLLELKIKCKAKDLRR